MKKTGILVLGLLFFMSFYAYTQVKLPKLIGDGMVLQRETSLKIWGWATPGEKIKIDFLNKSFNALADANGKWEISLPPFSAGGPYEMKVNDILLKNILIGDVWICSGQSNMELPISRVAPLYMDEIANAKNSYIRQFFVPQTYNFKNPQEDLISGSWKEVTPENILNFSAVAYFFAKEIYNKYKVPVGLINVSLGGSPAEAWMSEEALKQFPVHYEEVQKFKNDTLIQQIETEDRTRISAWYKILSQKDEGYRTPGKRWSDPSVNTSGWQTMKIPGYWKNTDLGAINGVVWFKKDIRIPQAIAGKKAKLNLGCIVNADSVFVNGTFVGNTTYQYPPRRYVIPEGALKEGNNNITIRVVNTAGSGGFVPDKPYQIVCGEQTIDLKGDWQYKLGATMEPLQGETFIRWKPEGLFNAMINPLLHYRIKGVIWYQGESNADRPVEYRSLFPAMIQDWRKHWQQGDFPFLFVQLANFMEAKPQPSESGWALLREAQLKTLALLNTGMAVTIDIGEWNDIHPLNKKDVGKRLALAAEKIAYNEKNIVYSGPTYKSMQVEGNKIILTFDNTGSGLMIKGDKKLKQFAISGADKQFVWADAVIENNKVIVWNNQVSNPVAVRYAWADNPEGANLYNKEGLPAAPFRTNE